jgi:hypothetical protein
VSASRLALPFTVALLTTACGGSEAEPPQQGGYAGVRSTYEAFHDARTGYIYGRVQSDELIRVTDRARAAAERFHDGTKSDECAKFVAGWLTEIATFSGRLHTGSFDDEPAASADAIGERMEEMCD